jgi:hypothetical protein
VRRCLDCVGICVIPRANVVVALLGHPGSGKLTISRALSPRIGALIVDNHWVCNPIFGLLEADGIISLKEGVWEQVGKVRDAVMETIATLSPPDKSFIFTFCASEEWPPDHAVLSSIQRTAERRETTFVPIRVLCAEEELVRRITSPGRKERLKLPRASGRARSEIYSHRSSSQEPDDTGRPLGRVARY